HVPLGGWAAGCWTMPTSAGYAKMEHKSSILCNLLKLRVENIMDAVAPGFRGGRAEKSAKMA
ncbi:MAG: hypothetical protein WCD46_12700, partial [Desulfobacterales bacterium]